VTRRNSNKRGNLREKPEKSSKELVLRAPSNIQVALEEALPLSLVAASTVGSAAKTWKTLVTTIRINSALLMTHMSLRTSHLLLQLRQSQQLQLRQRAMSINHSQRRGEIMSRKAQVKGQDQSHQVMKMKRRRRRKIKRLNQQA
jgi:hypothetical protein